MHFNDDSRGRANNGDFWWDFVSHFRIACGSFEWNKRFARIDRTTRKIRRADRMSCVSRFWFQSPTTDQFICNAIRKQSISKLWRCACVEQLVWVANCVLMDALGHLAPHRTIWIGAESRFRMSSCSDKSNFSRPHLEGVIPTESCDDIRFTASLTQTDPMHDVAPSFPVKVRNLKSDPLNCVAFTSEPVYSLFTMNAPSSPAPSNRCRRDGKKSM